MISFMVPTSTLVADSGRCHFWPIDFAAVPRPKQPWPLYARYKWMAKAEPKGCPRTFCMMGEGIMWKISLALGEQRRSQTHIAMPQNWTGIAFKQSRHTFGLFFFKQVLHFFWVNNCSCTLQFSNSSYVRIFFSFRRSVLFQSVILL